MFSERAGAFQSFICNLEKRKKCGSKLSVEWIGTKIQKTPGILNAATFIVHEDMSINNFAIFKSHDLRSLEKLKYFANNYIIEGFVVKDRRYFPFLFSHFLLFLELSSMNPQFLFVFNKVLMPKIYFIFNSNFG